MSEQKRRRRRGSGSIVKRGNVYWLYHTRFGKLEGKSLGTSSKQEAEQKARRILQEIDNEIARNNVLAQIQPIRILPVPDTYDINPALYAEHSQRAVMEHLNKMSENLYNQRQLITNSPTLDAVWKLGTTVAQDSGHYIEVFSRSDRSMSTLSSYRTSYNKFRRSFPKIEFLHQVDESVTSAFEEICIKQGLSKAAVNQYVLNLQAVWTTIIKDGFYKGTNPFHPKTTRAKKQKMVEFLSTDEVKAILEAARNLEDKDTYLFIAIAVHTGMRKTEVANLRWEDIDFENRIVKVQFKKEDPANGIQAFNPKSKQARAIPLKKELASILADYRQETGYILKPESQTRRSQWNVRELKKIVDATGIKFTPHFLRHTFASLASIQGVSIYKIQRWLGHSNVELTADIYAHLSPNDEDIDRF